MLERLGPSGLLRLAAVITLGASLFLAGCATSGNAAAVQACMETAIGAIVGPYTEGAYP